MQGTNGGRDSPAWFRVLLWMMLIVWLFEGIRSFAFPGWIHALHPLGPLVYAGARLLLLSLVVSSWAWGATRPSPIDGARGYVLLGASMAFLALITVLAAWTSAREAAVGEQAGIGPLDVPLLFVGALGTAVGAFLGRMEDRRRRKREGAAEAAVPSLP